MMLEDHSRCGRRGTEPARSRLEGEILRRLREGGSCRAYVVAVADHRVVPTMTVTAAGFAFLLDVSDFATRRELTIASDDAPAGESGEAKKPNETHKTLKPTASRNCQIGEQVPYPGTTDFLGVPSLVIIDWVRAR
jgi:hypothetical protein